MKRLLSLLLPVLLLTGCFQTPPAEEPAPQEGILTSERVEELYREASEVYDWFTACSPPCVGDTVELDGQHYRQTDIPGICTYAELEAKVRSLFSPYLSDQLLAESQNFRDIDGKLFCAEGGRGSNIFLDDVTVQVSHPDETHFTVELLFWTNSAMVPGGYMEDEVTFGYSREVLNYEEIDEGFRFTNFCSADDLDLEADTVHTFRYEEDFGAYQELDDWGLLCWLANADGAYAEGAAELLYQRFLERPQDILPQLALLFRSPYYVHETPPYFRDLVLLPAYEAAHAPEDDGRFLAALNTCQPEPPEQQEVQKLLLEKFTALSGSET